jgi:hypothetical protein
MVLYLPATTIGVIPQAPANLTATESNAGEVDLSWNYDVDIANDFIITVTDPSGNSNAYTVDSNTFSYAATGLTPDENDTFTVQADAELQDGTPGQSAPATVTAAASGTPLTASGPMSIAENDDSETLTLDSGIEAVSTVTQWTINWTDINGVPISTDTFTGTSATDAYPATTSTGLIANVTAVDAAGYTFMLPQVNIDVLPVAPSWPSATAVSPNEIDLSWINPSSLATEEEILVSTDGTNFSYFDTTSASNSTYAATGLLPGTPYTFELVALDDNGDESATPSLTTSATTDADPWQSVVTGPSTVSEAGTYHLSLSNTQTAGDFTFSRWD